MYIARSSDNKEIRSNRLAEILRHEASLLEHIVTDQRFYPDYFRVAFFGKFPNAIRGKQFVVCRKPSITKSSNDFSVSRI